MKTARFRYGLLMGIGIVVLAYTRPYEGLLLCVPVAAALGRWMLKAKNRPPALVLARRAAFPMVLIVAAAAWLGYYDMKAFGKATTLPYTIDRNTYAISPYYIWQPARARSHVSVRGVEIFIGDGDGLLRRFTPPEVRTFFAGLNC